MSNIIPITDFSAPELDIYARLSEIQLFRYHEPENGLFIAESPKVIERALDMGYTPVSMLVEEKQITGQAKQIIDRCKDIPVYTAELPVLTRLTGYQLTRGILCAMRRRTLPDIKELCTSARRIVVLERIMNPTNVGAIFRSAAALGMDAILLTPSCTDPLYRRAVRVSMGTVFQIPWTFLDREASVPVLKELGFTTAAMALHPLSIGIDDPRLPAADRLAVILGSEGDGLSTDTIAECDFTVRIPMAHGVDSLNVAAASAVAFWQLGRTDT
ncbi:MAG: RNA methyltransferase [Lachnospiraceae bacterium]|nr:RNA methyltransferase [Lachnospiraceae bacterium]